MAKVVKHYHVQIAEPPGPELFSGSDAPRVQIGQHAHAFA
jgi:hypothetical protein